jgi:amino acid transporter
VDARFRSPTRAVWLSATLSFILALPSLGSSVAFAAATSIATIGLYLSYGLPILIGLICHRSFTAMKGPFNLHALSRPIAAAACLWIGFITVVFCLPTANPVTSQTFNYTAVAVGILSLFAVGSWVVWAHRWFTGPSAEVAEALRLGVDIMEPGALEEREKQTKGSLAVADRVGE